MRIIMIRAVNIHSITRIHIDDEIDGFEWENNVFDDSVEVSIDEMDQVIQMTAMKI